MLSVEGLDVFYGDAQALDAVELTVPEGAIVAIVGANGAGKTTLIRAIAGMLRPARGLSSALAAGFLEVAPPKGEWRVFTELHEALAWIGPPGEDLARDLAEIEHAADTPAVIRALRDWLVAHPAEATLARAATALGSSGRSLQRKLAEVGTRNECSCTVWEVAPPARANCTT